MSQQAQRSPLRSEATRLLRWWALLLVLGGAEFGASFLPLRHVARPLVMIPGVLMVAAVAVGFMNIARAPLIARAFAVAAMFWLFVLLGLGSVDPLTRIDYAVPGSSVGAYRQQGRASHADAGANMVSLKHGEADSL